LYQACTGLKGSPLLLAIGLLNKLLLEPMLLLPMLLLEAGTPRLTPMLARTSAVLLLAPLLLPENPYPGLLSLFARKVFSCAGMLVCLMLESNPPCICAAQQRQASNNQWH
jgi:hypothetical protein